MKFPKNVNRKFLTKIFVLLLFLTNFSVAYSECNENGDEWECDDGQCISGGKLCDGNIDCGDRSDEIAENCIQVRETCPSYAFSCTYGGCIEGNSTCNGVKDCADNSDELICNKKDDSFFQGTCTDTEIQCFSSKECINSIYLCDGNVDCSDGSDESLELCINFGCVSYGFQCGYGACIRGTAKCNGIIECADGSDEAWMLCDTPRKKPSSTDVTPAPTTTPAPIPATNIKCFIPDEPIVRNLLFKLHPLNKTIEIGSYVQNFEIIHIACKNKDTLKTQQSLLCNNGRWNNDFPTCDGFCDGTVFKRLSLRAICYYRSDYVECPKKILPRTSIQVNCAFGYTRNPNIPQLLKCQSDGTLDDEPKPCEQNCGKIASNSEVLSKDGIPIDVSLAPWHVAIYENSSDSFIYKCSGSIVSPRIIMTAAHCFWDEPNLLLKSHLDYQIIAGRSTSNFTTIENNHSRLVRVQEISIPTEYIGRGGRQKDDIAFLKLESPLQYSETIAPICIPTELRNTGSTYVLSNETGYINGFGLKNQLERLRMITLAYHDCKAISPDNAPVAEDKFCIYNAEGGAVCRGDSGGGFYKADRYKTNGIIEIVYELWGVISNTPATKNDCTRTDEKAYVAITNIYDSPSEFRRKLKNARKEDEALF